MWQLQLQLPSGNVTDGVQSGHHLPEYKLPVLFTTVDGQWHRPPCSAGIFFDVKLATRQLFAARLMYRIV